MCFLTCRGTDLVLKFSIIRKAWSIILVRLRHWWDQTRNVFRILFHFAHQSSNHHPRQCERAGARDTMRGIVLHLVVLRKARKLPCLLHAHRVLWPYRRQTETSQTAKNQKGRPRGHRTTTRFSFKQLGYLIRAHTR